MRTAWWLFNESLALRVSHRMYSIQYWKKRDGDTGQGVVDEGLGRTFHMQPDIAGGLMGCIPDGRLQDEMNASIWPGSLWLAVCKRRCVKTGHGSGKGRGTDEC